MEEDMPLELDYDQITQNMLTAIRDSGVVAHSAPPPVTYESQLEAACCKLSMIPTDVWRQIPQDI